MTASPKGYPFERIDYDAGQLNSLHGHLEDAVEKIGTMQLVLRNVADNLEGDGQALDRARSTAEDVAAAFTSPAARVRRIKTIVIDYGRGAEEHGGTANSLMTAVTDAQTALSTADSDLTDARTDLGSWERSEEFAAWRAGEETTTAPRTLLARDDRYREAVDSAEGARDRAASDLEDAWTAWERSFESWDDAYARAVAALAGVDAGYVPSADAATLAALADADTPAEVAAVWDTLSDTDKAHLAEKYPDLVGNLEGVPYEYRIAANIEALNDASGTGWGEPADTDIRVLLAELNEHSGFPVSLNLFDRNQATAAMLYVDDVNYDPNAVLGDPLAGIDKINVLVGGMMSEVNQMRDWGQSATDLNDSIRPPGSRSATLVWFGYDTPNFSTVNNSNQARVGAESLTNALLGLDFAAPTDATTSVVAHSYGTTTAFLAIGSSDDNLGVDNLISLGSAGLTEQALGDDPGRGMDYSGTDVFTTRGPNDWVSLIGKGVFSDHGIDPDSLDGATTFESDGAILQDGSYLEDTPGHGTHSEANLPIGIDVNDGGYLQLGSESFANIANIISFGEPLPDNFER